MPCVTAANKIMVEVQRFDRQARIPGWKQSALENATLTIVGYNTFAEYLSLAASALGIGTVRIIATPQDNAGLEASILKLSTKQSRPARLAELASNVGTAKVDIILAHMEAAAEKWYLSSSSAVIDATGRNESRALSLDFAREQKKDKPVYCELVHFGDGFIFRNNSENPFGIHNKRSQAPDTVCSMIAAGATLEEVKNNLFGSAPARESMSYSFPIKQNGRQDYSNLRALVIGAGALGNSAIASLSDLGLMYIDIIDNDEIEETNLNRQILFYNSVGRKKAEVLAEKGTKIAGNGADYAAIIKRFDENTDIKKYDLVFDCVDNPETRLLVSRRCAKEKKVLISGGTSPSAGQAVVYVPGVTTCPQHALNLERQAEGARKEQEKLQATGCIAQPNPSVIMSNFVTGGLIVNSMRQAAYPEIFGMPLSGQVRYDANGPRRFGKIEVQRCGE